MYGRLGTKYDIFWLSALFVMKDRSTIKIEVPKIEQNVNQRHYFARRQHKNTKEWNTIKRYAQCKKPKIQNTSGEWQ